VVYCYVQIKVEVEVVVVVVHEHLLCQTLDIAIAHHNLTDSGNT
jgi:hypothetical protein